MVEVPYRVSSQALTDTIGGQIPLNFPSLAAVLPQIRAGNLRALGISSAERSSAAPDIPANGETVEGYEASSWYGMVTQRSEEHTSELQSLIRISYAVFCLKKKNKK